MTKKKSEKNKKKAAAPKKEVLKDSKMIQAALRNISKMDKKEITETDTSMFGLENKIFREKPYYYRHIEEINWENVLKIINNPKKCEENSFLIKFALKDIKIVAIIANYFIIENLYNTIITWISDCYYIYTKS